MRLFPGLVVATIVAVAVAAASVATAARAPGLSIQLTEAGSQFPSRSYVLTLSKGFTIRSSSVRVTENGAPVQGVRVVPARNTKAGKFGVVLVLDASDSMAGRPIAAAIAAARVFAAHRSGAQKLGLVTFNSTATTKLALTDRQARVDAVLAQTPKLAYGTHMYGATLKALHMLQGAGISSGSIVLLSDGADTGSRITEPDLVAAAKKAHVRIFTVGFRSGVFDSSTLTELAGQTGGTFSTAQSKAQLEQVYGSLGERLSREYLLQYQSLAGPGENVKVRVVLDGIAQPADTGYTTPALRHFAQPPFHPSAVSEFWRSAWAMVAFALVCALLLAGALLALLRPTSSGFQHRVAEFVSLYSRPDEPKRGGGLAESVRVGAERSFEETSRWRRLAINLEIAEIALSPLQVVLGTVIATVFAVLFFATVLGQIFGVFGFLVPLFVFNGIKAKLARKRARFANQLPDTLQVIASAMRAGHTIIGALAVVAGESPEPTRAEMRRVVADEQFGVPLEDALDRVAARMASLEFGQVALVAGLQREAGGNVAEVLDRVGETVRERIELRQLVKSLTAQGRLSRWILTLLPPGLAGIIAVLDPGYLSPLIDKSAGRAIIVFAGIMIVIGSITIKRIVEIKI
jgi:tight adherence protein B